MKQRELDGRASTPIPSNHGKGASTSKPTDLDMEMRLVIEGFRIHERYGGEYMDQNPITGRPGEFHLSSTGRKENLAVSKPGPSALKGEALPALNTKIADNPLAKSGKETKSPKTPNIAKPKRRKSKIATTPS